MKTTVILGLNCSHDAAAAIAVNGALVSAISEERISRVKHFDGLPRKAIDYCFDHAKLDRQSVTIDAVVLNQMPLISFERQVRQILGGSTVSSIIINPSHHYLHACYAEMMTTRRPMVVLVVDGSGYSYAEHLRRGSPFLGPEPANMDAWESLSAFYINEYGMTSLILKSWGEWVDGRSLRFPSLGHLYGSAAQHIFGSWVHAGKLMGLAPYGDPLKMGGKPIVSLTTEGIEVDPDWVSQLPKIHFASNFEQVPMARNLAARIQSELERAMMHLCNLLYERTRCDTICLTGGVALNSVFNGRLVKDGPFKHVVVTPASSDSGTAIGGAAYGYKQLTGRSLRFDGDPEFLGRNYEPEAIAAFLEDTPELIVQECDLPVDAAVQDLVEQRLVGWFEGPSEFGPRALGHRSILADPRSADAKSRLNSRVKFRESFRPYAASVLEEYCASWFDQPVESPHMLMVAAIKANKRELIPAVRHVDDTCRLQTVAQSYSGSLRALIERFFEKTGVPLLLNTSLNIHGQPIAETPQDALDCLLRSGLDVLYCGNRRVQRTKAAVPSSGELDQWIPVLSGGIFLMNILEVHDEFSHLADSSIRQGGRHVRVSSTEQRILMGIDGRKTLRDLAREVREETLSQLLACIHSLCEKGILYLKNSRMTESKSERVTG